MDMITSLLFYVTMIFLILEADRAAAHCEPKRKEFDKELPGMALNGKMLGSSNTEQVICQYSCHSHQNCDAYNYNSDEGRCEVLDARSSFFNVVKRAGWMFRALKCEAYQCNNGGTCFHAFGKDRCLCACGWKGELCDVPIPNSDNVLSFPGGSLDDIVIVSTPFTVSLNQLSISIWAQMDPTEGIEHPLASYGTSSTSDVITVMVKPNQTRIFINSNWSSGKFTDPNQSIPDNSWHHLLFTWENVFGKLVLYIDGVKRGEKINVAKGEKIKKNGALVIGQEQDSYLGSYELEQVLKGNLTSWNMWDRVLTASEISDLASKCPTKEGNLVTWSQLMRQSRSGNVKLICSSFCAP